MAPDTLEKAVAVAPIAALQSEYSLWARLPEAGVLEHCHRLGIVMVAYSPVARGFLGGELLDMSRLAANDLRHTMPRFQGAAFEHNVQRINALKAHCIAWGITPAQASLAWLLAQSLWLCRFRAHGLDSELAKILSP